MPDTVVLLSGGLDSTVVAASALAAGRLHSCLCVRYGQPHMEPEMMAARKWCDSHGVKRVVIDLPLPGVAAMHLGAGAAGPRVLPGRNLTLTAHAVQYAATVGATTVLIGACADDAADYPDCREEFIKAIATTAAVYGITVRAPLIKVDKAGVIGLAGVLGVDVWATWSCYEPKMRGFEFDPCGTCNACLARAKGLRDFVTPRP